MAALLLRIKTKDGTERLQCQSSLTLAQARSLIAEQLGVPVNNQALHRSKTGPGPYGAVVKGDAFTAADESQALSALGLANGDMLFLDYQMERENQAQYVEKDPFKTMVKEGELRAQGSDKWTLSNFLDYRSSKEFVLGAPPEPHAKFVQIDQRATQTLMNYMILTGFKCKRVGWLYGRWVTDEVTGDAGVQVHAIYEPRQDCTSDSILVHDDPEAEEKLAKLASMLGLVRVGCVIAHPAREYVLSVKELMYAARLHAKAVADDPEHGKRFITMKARPVLDTEKDIEGVATVEAYQISDQAVELVGGDDPKFYESKTDPRVAKTKADCTFVVEKKEVRKATMEHFVARVFDVGRQLNGQPFASFLSSGFAVENRPTELQDAQAMASYLRGRRSRGEPFLRTVADLHFLLFLANLLDMNNEMPVLCATIVEERAGDLEGFQLMINCAHAHAAHAHAAHAHARARARIRRYSPRILTLSSSTIWPRLTAVAHLSSLALQAMRVSSKLLVAFGSSAETCAEQMRGFDVHTFNVAARASAVGLVPKERARRERVHGQEDIAVCEVRPLQEAVEVQRQQVTRGDEGSW